MTGNFALVVDRRGAALEAGTHETVVVRHADGRTERVGMRALDALVVHGDVALSTGLLQALAAHEVALTVLPLRGRAPAVGFAQLPHCHVLTRHRQHLAFADDPTRLALARSVVVAKCEAMAGFARDFNLDPPDEFYAGIRSAGLVSDVPALLGVEGACSRHHFENLARTYARGGPFRFTGRSRRPPRDAPNAVMSLGYALAASQATRLALQAGLDVQLGFLHGLQRDRDSLVLDLIEPARAAIDGWVADLLQRRQLLSAAMFSESDAEGVRLSQEGRAVFYPAWFAEGCLQVSAPMRRLLATMVTLMRASPANACCDSEIGPKD